MFRSSSPCGPLHQLAEWLEYCHIFLLEKMPDIIAAIAMRFSPRLMIAGQEVACPFVITVEGSSFQSGVLN